MADIVIALLTMGLLPGLMLAMVCIIKSRHSSTRPRSPLKLLEEQLNQRPRRTSLQLPIANPAIPERDYNVLETADNTSLSSYSDKKETSKARCWGYLTCCHWGKTKDEISFNEDSSLQEIKVMENICLPQPTRSPRAETEDTFMENKEICFQNLTEDGVSLSQKCVQPEEIQPKITAISLEKMAISSAVPSIQSKEGKRTDCQNTITAPDEHTEVPTNDNINDEVVTTKTRTLSYCDLIPHSLENRETNVDNADGDKIFERASCSSKRREKSPSRNLSKDKNETFGESEKRLHLSKKKSYVMSIDTQVQSNTRSVYRVYGSIRPEHKDIIRKGYIENTPELSLPLVVKQDDSRPININRRVQRRGFRRLTSFTLRGGDNVGNLPEISSDKRMFSHFPLPNIFRPYQIEKEGNQLMSKQPLKNIPFVVSTERLEDGHVRYRLLAQQCRNIGDHSSRREENEEEIMQTMKMLSKNRYAVNNPVVATVLTSHQPPKSRDELTEVNTTSYYAMIPNKEGQRVHPRKDEEIMRQTGQSTHSELPNRTPVFTSFPEPSEYFRDNSLQLNMESHSVTSENQEQKGRDSEIGYSLKPLTFNNSVTNNSRIQHDTLPENSEINIPPTASYYAIIPENQGQCLPYKDVFRHTEMRENKQRHFMASRAETFSNARDTGIERQPQQRNVRGEQEVRELRPLIAQNPYSRDTPTFNVVSTHNVFTQTMHFQNAPMQSSYPQQATAQHAHTQVATTQNAQTQNALLQRAPAQSLSTESTRKQSEMCAGRQQVEESAVPQTSYYAIIPKNQGQYYPFANVRNADAEHEEIIDRISLPQQNHTVSPALNRPSGKTFGQSELSFNEPNESVVLCGRKQGDESNVHQVSYHATFKENQACSDPVENTKTRENINQQIRFPNKNEKILPTSQWAHAENASSQSKPNKRANTQNVQQIPLNQQRVASSVPITSYNALVQPNPSKLYTVGNVSNSDNSSEQIRLQTLQDIERTKLLADTTQNIGIPFSGRQYGDECLGLPSTSYYAIIPKDQGQGYPHENVRKLENVREQNISYENPHVTQKSAFYVPSSQNTPTQNTPFAERREDIRVLPPTCYNTSVTKDKGHAMKRSLSHELNELNNKELHKRTLTGDNNWEERDKGTKTNTYEAQPRQSTTLSNFLNQNKSTADRNSESIPTSLTSRYAFATVNPNQKQRHDRGVDGQQYEIISTENQRQKLSQQKQGWQGSNPYEQSHNTYQETEDRAPSTMLKHQPEANNKQNVTKRVSTTIPNRTNTVGKQDDDIKTSFPLTSYYALIPRNQGETSLHEGNKTETIASESTPYTQESQLPFSQLRQIAERDNDQHNISTSLYSSHEIPYSNARQTQPPPHQEAVQDKRKFAHDENRTCDTTTELHTLPKQNEPGNQRSMRNDTTLAVDSAIHPTCIDMGRHVQIPAQDPDTQAKIEHVKAPKPYTLHIPGDTHTYEQSQWNALYDELTARKAISTPSLQSHSKVENMQRGDVQKEKRALKGLNNTQFTPEMQRIQMVMYEKTHLKKSSMHFPSEYEQMSERDFNPTNPVTSRDTYVHTTDSLNLTRSRHRPSAPYLEESVSFPSTSFYSFIPRNQGQFPARLGMYARPAQPDYPSTNDRVPYSINNPITMRSCIKKADSDESESSTASSEESNDVPTPVLPVRPSYSQVYWKRSDPKVREAIEKAQKQRVHDILNQYSSIHISHNMKDPIPKDPETMPGFKKTASKRQMAESLSHYGSSQYRMMPKRSPLPIPPPPSKKDKENNKDKEKEKKSRSFFNRNSKTYAALVDPNTNISMGIERRESDDSVEMKSDNLERSDYMTTTDSKIHEKIIPSEIFDKNSLSNVDKTWNVPDVNVHAVNVSGTSSNIGKRKSGRLLNKESHGPASASLKIVKFKQEMEDVPIEFHSSSFKEEDVISSIKSPHSFARAKHPSSPTRVSNVAVNGNYVEFEPDDEVEPYASPRYIEIKSGSEQVKSKPTPQYSSHQQLLRRSQIEIQTNVETNSELNPTLRMMKSSDQGLAEHSAQMKRLDYNTSVGFVKGQVESETIQLTPNYEHYELKEKKRVDVQATEKDPPSVFQVHSQVDSRTIPIATIGSEVMSCDIMGGPSYHFTNIANYKTQSQQVPSFSNNTDKTVVQVRNSNDLAIDEGSRNIMESNSRALGKSNQSTVSEELVSAPNLGYSTKSAVYRSDVLTPTQLEYATNQTSVFRRKKSLSKDQNKDGSVKLLDNLYKYGSVTESQTSGEIQAGFQQEKRDASLRRSLILTDNNPLDSKNKNYTVEAVENIVFTNEREVAERFKHKGVKHISEAYSPDFWKRPERSSPENENEGKTSSLKKNNFYDNLLSDEADASPEYQEKLRESYLDGEEYEESILYDDSDSKSPPVALDMRRMTPLTTAKEQRKTRSKEADDLDDNLLLAQYLSSKVLQDPVEEMSNEYSCLHVSSSFSIDGKARANPIDVREQQRFTGAIESSLCHGIRRDSRRNSKNVYFTHDQRDQEDTCSLDNYTRNSKTQTSSNPGGPPGVSLNSGNPATGQDTTLRWSVVIKHRSSQLPRLDNEKEDEENEPYLTPRSHD